VLSELGNPSLAEAFCVPPSSNTSVEVEESWGRKTVRIRLGNHHAGEVADIYGRSQPQPQAPYNHEGAVPNYSHLLVAALTGRSGTSHSGGTTTTTDGHPFSPIQHRAFVPHHLRGLAASTQPAGLTQRLAGATESAALNQFYDAPVAVRAAPSVASPTNEHHSFVPPQRAPVPQSAACSSKKAHGSPLELSLSLRGKTHEVPGPAYVCRTPPHQDGIEPESPRSPGKYNPWAEQTSEANSASVVKKRMEPKKRSSPREPAAAATADSPNPRRLPRFNRFLEQDGSPGTTIHKNTVAKRQPHDSATTTSQQSSDKPVVSSLASRKSSWRVTISLPEDSDNSPDAPESPPDSAPDSGSGAETPVFGQDEDVFCMSAPCVLEARLRLPNGAVPRRGGEGGLGSTSSNGTSPGSERGSGSPSNRRPESTKNSLALRRGMKLSLSSESHLSPMQTPKSAPTPLSDTHVALLHSKGGSERKESIASSNASPFFSRLPSAGSANNLLGCVSPESQQAGTTSCSLAAPTPSHRLASEVLLMGNAIPRPLPGAFPTRRTVFFLDWDDTLCPTSWIRSILKTHMADLKLWCDLDELEVAVDWRDAIPGWFSQPLPDEPKARDWIAELQKAVIGVLEAAQAYGVVCIVTNSIPGWVGKTIRKWLPKLKQYIDGHGVRPPIKVLYGQQIYKKPTGAAASLPWVDDLGPYMWWKKSAMSLALDEVDDLFRVDNAEGKRGGQALNEVDDQPDNDSDIFPSISWCNHADSKRIASVISVGDDEAEMQAVDLATHNFEEERALRGVGGASSSGLQRRDIPHEITSGNCGLENACSSRWPCVKKVKMKERPHIKQLTAELQEIREMIPRMVLKRQNFRINLDRNQSDLRRERIVSGFDPSTPHEPRNRCALLEELLSESASLDGDHSVESLLRVQTV